MVASETNIYVSWQVWILIKTSGVDVLTGVTSETRKMEGMKGNRITRYQGCMGEIGKMEGDPD